MAYILRYLTRLGAGLFLCWHMVLLGQHAATPREDTFTVYAVDESPAWDKLYYLPSPKESVKLVFQSNNRSAVLKASGPAKPLVFGVEQIDPVTQHKTYLPVAETAWPTSATKVLAVFAVATGPKGEKQVRVQAFDDGPKAFPLRTVRIFNATGVPLLAKVAGYEGAVPAGMSPAYAYPVVSEDPNRVGSYPLAFAVSDAQAEMKLLHRSYGEAWPLGRSLVFVLLPKKGETVVQVRTLVDAPPAPEL